MPAPPDYEFEGRKNGKVVGYRLIRLELDKSNEKGIRYGCVEFKQWSREVPDLNERQYWYEVSFAPFGNDSKVVRTPTSQHVPETSNRLNFSVVRRPVGGNAGEANQAKLGPHGNIGMKPPSVGLGTYLRDELIDWVAGLHPDASVAKGMLSSKDAGAENRDRRKRFYEGGGFKVREYEDGDGAFWAHRLGDLVRHSSGRRVVELSRVDVQEMLQRATELEKAKLELKVIGEERDRLKSTAAKAKTRIWCAKWGAYLLLGLLLFATTTGKLSWHLF